MNMIENLLVIWPLEEVLFLLHPRLRHLPPLLSSKEPPINSSHLTLAEKGDAPLLLPSIERLLTPLFNGAWRRRTTVNSLLASVWPLR